MNKILQICTIALLLAQVIFADTPVAVIANSGGLAEINKLPGVDWLMARPGSLINLNTQLRTGEDGFIVLVFVDDRSTLSIRSNTLLTLDGDIEDGSITKRIALSFGEIFNEVQEQNKSYEVETPTSVASVKGTQFWVIVSSLDSLAAYYGIEGTVGIVGESDDSTSLISNYVVTTSSAGFTTRTATDDEIENLKDIHNAMENGDYSVPFVQTIHIGDNVTNNVEKISAENMELIRLDAADIPDYTFHYWEVDSGAARLLDPVSSESKVAVIGGDCWLTAIYHHNDSLPEEINLPAIYELIIEGIDPSSERVFYVPKGERVPLEVTIPLGTYFEGWEVISGDVMISNMNKSTSVRVNSDAKIKAVTSESKSIEILLKSIDGSQKRVILEYHN